MTLLKAIIAVLLIVLGVSLIIGPPLVTLGVIVLTLVLLAVAWSLWFVLTIERHFEGGNRLAAKAIEPGYGDAKGHSNKAP